MIIKDKQVIKWLKALKLYDLEEDIAEYPEDERDGRTDIEFFADELSYWISLCEEEGCSWNDALTKAREILRETKNGKSIPIYQNFKPKYQMYEIEDAKQTVNEYKRMKYRYKKLNELGVYGSY